MNVASVAKTDASPLLAQYPISDEAIIKELKEKTTTEVYGGRRRRAETGLKRGREAKKKDELVEMQEYILRRPLNITTQDAKKTFAGAPRKCFCPF